MKRHWTEDELETDWRLLPNEKTLIKGKQGATRLGFAVLLKFFQYEGRFPSNPADVPSVVIPHLAEQVLVNPEFWLEYPWEGRATGYHRASIRAFCGYREATLGDGEKLEDWLVQEVLMREQMPERIQECAFDYCRQCSIEPPGPERLKRIIVNAVNRQEILFCERFFQQLSPAAVAGLEALLQTSDESETTRTAWQDLKTEPGKAGLESIKETASRLNLARKIGLPPDIFKSVQPQLLERYVKQTKVEEPHELRRHAQPLKNTLLAIFLHRRTEELTDHLVDLLVETVHKMSKKAETKIEKSLGDVLQKAPQKFAKLYLMAKAAVTAPQGIVSEVIYPAAPEKWLNDLIQEVEGKGSGYRGTVRRALHRSYQAHYRRILPELLNNLEFRWCPPIIALAVLIWYTLLEDTYREELVMLEIGNFFCTNPDCKDYGIRSKRNLNVQFTYGKSGKHMLYCTTCKSRFSQTRCTAFFGTKYSAKQIGSIIRCTAEGNGVRATGRILGLDKNAVNRVILKAGEHCQMMMTSLLFQLGLTEVQMDELWSFIEKKVLWE